MELVGVVFGLYVVVVFLGFVVYGEVVYVEGFVVVVFVV